MIMKGRAPLRLPWAGLVALVVVASATLPAWASGSVTENGQQPAPAAPPAVAAGQATPVPPAAQQPTQAPVVVPAPAQAKPQPAQPSKAVVQVKPTVAPTPHGTPAPAVHVAVPVDVHQQVTHVLQEKPQPARHVTVAPTPSRRATFTFFPATTELTPEGQKLVEKFDTQREAIQKELDARIEAERQSIIKELQTLQDQYAKAGKLDEAVAIRDYLKAGGPANPAKYSWVIRR